MSSHKTSNSATKIGNAFRKALRNSKSDNQFEISWCEQFRVKTLHKKNAPKYSEHLNLTIKKLTIIMKLSIKNIELQPLLGPVSNHQQQP